jgi:hypothetical protein
MEIVEPYIIRHKAIIHRRIAKPKARAERTRRNREQIPPNEKRI